jgi:hypothetical protein
MSEVTSIAERREIPGLPGYAADTDGNIWSEWKKRRIGGNRGGMESYQSGEWHQLKPAVTSSGYLAFAAKRTTFHVHKAVLLAFVGPKPEGCNECRHLDGNRLNNRLGNLCWGTYTENQEDRKRHGTMPKGEENGNSKLTAEQVEEIRKLRESGMSYRKIAAKYGVHMGAIWYVVNTGWK